jgi:DNA-binding transcriptional LysR family regulator
MSKPGLTLHRLELFLAVLDHGGVGRAARARHISQPAVTEHLKGLEAYFGVPLFERSGRTLRPTAGARLLEPYARRTVGLVRSAERAAAQYRGLEGGSLTVGASTTPGTYLVPAALGRFHHLHPAVGLRLRIGDSREVEQWVVAGDTELGVIGEAPLGPGLVGEPWVEDELVAIVARGHRLARRRTLPPAALASEPYIAREEGSSTRGVAERFLSNLGLALTPAMELGGTEALREAVAAGLGVAIVSRHAVLPRDRRIVALRIAGPRWRRDLLIVRREDAPLSPAATRFRDLLLGAGAAATRAGGGAPADVRSPAR